ncbi:MAG: hypothetical protein QF752_15580 [Planctomycetota bacterium]|nr:hypothetical protein [Planctomycetota bacterium]
MGTTRSKFLLCLLLVTVPTMAWGDNFKFGQFNPKRHLRFLNWGTKEMTHNPDFFLAKYKITGVGFLGRKARENWVFKAPGIYEKAQEKVEPKLRQFVLITPQHILMAQHFRLREGAKVKFLNEDNKLVLRKVDRVDHIEDDVAIARFETPFEPDDKVTHIPIATRLPKRLAGKHAFYFVGKYVPEGHRLPGAGVTRIARFLKTKQFKIPFLGYNPKLTEGPFANDGALGIGGDSGSPTLVDLDGKLGVLGAHQTGTLDPWTGAVVDRINEKIAPDKILLTVSDEGAPYFSKDKGLVVSWRHRTFFDTRNAHHATPLYFHNFSDRATTLTLSDDSEFFAFSSETVTIPPDGGTATVNLVFSPIRPKLYRVNITARLQGESDVPFRGAVQQQYVGNDLTPAPAEEKSATKKSGE